MPEREGVRLIDEGRKTQKMTIDLAEILYPYPEKHLAALRRQYSG